MGIGLHLSKNLSGLVLIGTQGDLLRSVAPVQFDAPGLATTTIVVVAQVAMQVLVLAWLIQRRQASAALPVAA